MKLKKYDAKFIISLVCPVVILTVGLFNIEALCRIRIVDDEFCYWGIAASLSGYDWKSLVGASSYYSFGYSVLLLPLFGLSHMGVSMSVIYKLAIMMNVMLLLGCYFLTLYAIKGMDIPFSSPFRQLVGVVVTLSLGNLVYMKFAWSETYLCFMFWCVICLIIRVIKTPGYGNLLALVTVTFNMLAIHMRSVGIIIAVYIILLFYFLNDVKGLWKKGIYTLLISVLFALVFYFCKQYVSDEIYLNHAVDSVNNVSVQMASAKALLSIRGIVDFLLSVAGKLYYSGASSFLLVLFGLLIAISMFWSNVVKKIKNRDYKWRTREWLILFVLLAYCGEICVSAIFKCNEFFSQDQKNAMIDSIFFGRYTDFVIGPMIILGIYGMKNISKHYGSAMTVVLLFFVLTVIVQYQLDYLAFYNENLGLGIRPLASPWLSVFSGGTVKYFAYYASGISSVVFVLLCLIGNYSKGKNHNLFGLSLLIMAFLLSILGNKIARDYNTGKSVKVKTVDTVAEIVKQTDEKIRLYVVKEGEQTSFTDIKILQWAIPQRSITMINSEKINEINTENALVFCESSDDFIKEVLERKLEYIFDSGTISVFCSHNNQYYADICKKADEVYSIPNPIIADVNLSSVTTDLSYVKPNGSLYYNYLADEGYMTKEMNVSLENGIYEFTIDMRARECQAGTEIGYITVGTDANDIQSTKILDANDFIEKERQKITVSVEIKNQERPVIGVYTYGDAAFRIYGISYRQTKRIKDY